LEAWLIASTEIVHITPAARVLDPLVRTAVEML